MKEGCEQVLVAATMIGNLPLATMIQDSLVAASIMTVGRLTTVAMQALVYHNTLMIQELCCCHNDRELATCYNDPGSYCCCFYNDRGEVDDSSNVGFGLPQYVDDTGTLLPP